MSDTIYFVDRTPEGHYDVIPGQIRYEYQYCDEVSIKSEYGRLDYPHIKKSNVFYDYDKAVLFAKRMFELEKEAREAAKQKSEYQLQLEDIDNTLLRWIKRHGGNFDTAKEYRDWLLSLPDIEYIDLRIFNNGIEWRYEKPKTHDDWKPIMKFEPKKKITDNSDIPFPMFLGFTYDMWDGNEPTASKNVNGAIENKWITKYGDGLSYGDDLNYGVFNVHYPITIYIRGDLLEITKLNHSNPRCYSSKGYSFVFKHTLMEHEEIERILNTSIPNCKYWDIVQSKAKRLYYKTSLEAQSSVI